MGIAKFDKGYAEQMESMTGYTMFTTFWDDFAIAERMGIIVQNGQYVRTDVNRGIVAIEDTFNRAFKEWKTNYKYLTELVMVLSWKSSRFSSPPVADIEEYSELYAKLFTQARNWALDNLKDEAFAYFWETTD